MDRGSALNFFELRKADVASVGVLAIVATGTSGASSLGEGGHKDVLVQPNDSHLREGTRSTLN